MTFSLEILCLATQPTNIISPPRRFLEARIKQSLLKAMMYSVLLCGQIRSLPVVSLFFLRPLLISSSFNEQLIQFCILQVSPEGGGGGGPPRKFWGGMGRWDPGTLDLYQS